MPKEPLKTPRSDQSRVGESGLKIIHGEDNLKKMPDEVKRALSQLTKFQRRYCEYRSKGTSQAKAAERAGSNAAPIGLARVGYNVESKAQAKTYLDWLLQARATYAMIDDVEIIEKARAVYDAAFDAGKYTDALKAADLLANMAGLLNKRGVGITDTKTMAKKTKNNVGAFKEEEETHQDRTKRFKALTEVLNQSKS